MRSKRQSATYAASAAAAASALRRTLLRCSSLSVARRQSLSWRQDARCGRSPRKFRPRRHATQPGSQINVDLWRKIRSLVRPTAVLKVLVTEFQMAAFVHARDRWYGHTVPNARRQQNRNDSMSGMLRHGGQKATWRHDRILVDNTVLVWSLRFYWRRYRGPKYPYASILTENIP